MEKERGETERARRRERGERERGERERGSARGGLEKGRENSTGRSESVGGDGGESEGGSQALARPVMIDWLAGSQQTDVRPPDQPAHPRANPPSSS